MIDLKCGDCIELIKEIPDNSVDLIVTDPPYFLGMTHNGLRGDNSDLLICKPFFSTLFKEYKRVLKEDGRIYFFTCWRGYSFYYELFNEVFPIKNLLVWDKGGRMSPYYSFGHELILYYSPPKAKPVYKSCILKAKSFNNGARKTNGDKVHPTQKTVEIIEELVLNSSNENDTILDTFMGSGTTGVVCKMNNRNFIGIELQEKYFEIAKKRIEEVSNRNL